MLAMVTATNVLSFSDSLLLIKEGCIDAFSDCIEDFVDAIKWWAAASVLALHKHCVEVGVLDCYPAHERVVFRATSARLTRHAHSGDASSILDMGGVP